jgi:hypothetical protein
MIVFVYIIESLKNVIDNPYNGEWVADILYRLRVFDIISQWCVLI